jgi:hypothetical protein
MQKKKIKIISKVFEYTHFMDKINVVLEIECNLMKDIQWPCLGLILWVKGTMNEPKGVVYIYEYPS